MSQPSLIFIMTSRWFPNGLRPEGECRRWHGVADTKGQGQPLWRPLCSNVSKSPTHTTNSREEQMAYGQISHQALKMIRKYKENSRPWGFPFFSALSPHCPSKPDFALFLPRFQIFGFRIQPALVSISNKKRHSDLQPYSEPKAFPTSAGKSSALPQFGSSAHLKMLSCWRIPSLQGGTVFETGI